MRPLLIIGTRPEAIKMAPVVARCRATEGVEPIVCTSGQHRELVEPLVDYFDLQPDVRLDVMDADASLAVTAARLIEQLDGVIGEYRPDWVVAQGDTTSTFAASAAAFYRQVPFLHVEAGLRTGNLKAPWPEEFHRRVTTLATTAHCAPTARAVEALRAEGVPEDAIHLTGNTIVDVLQEVLRRIDLDDNTRNRGFLDQCFRTVEVASVISSTVRKHQSKSLNSGLEVTEPMVLITGHRRENFGEGLESICRAILTLAEKFPEHTFLYAVHLNPTVRQTVQRVLTDNGHQNIRLIDPPLYPDFVRLMVQATLILSDSGGIQEETPTLGRPLLVLRETTERPEAIDAGTALLVGTDHQRIVAEASSLLTSEARRAAFGVSKNPFGDGQASRRIVEVMLRQ